MSTVIEGVGVVNAQCVEDDVQLLTLEYHQGEVMGVLKDYHIIFSY